MIQHARESNLQKRDSIIKEDDWNLVLALVIELERTVEIQ